MTTSTRKVVAGIGFRHAAEPEEVMALVRQAFAGADLPLDRLYALATASDRADEPTFRDAAAGFGVAALGVTAAALHTVDGTVPTRSGRIETGRGVGSLAEAAALAAAGAGAVLVLSRIKTSMATCALALLGRCL